MNLNAYRNAIRDLIDLLKSRAIAGQYIPWHVGSDEARDPSLLSLRAYGSREYIDVIMVACGTSGVWERLPEIDITLPLLVQVIQLKNLYATTA